MGSTPAWYRYLSDRLVPFWVCTDTCTVPDPAGAVNWMEPGFTARLEPVRAVLPQKTVTEEAGKKPMPVKVIRLPPASGPSGVTVLRTGGMSVSTWVTRLDATGAWAPPSNP